MMKKGTPGQQIWVLLAICLMVFQSCLFAITSTKKYGEWIFSRQLPSVPSSSGLLPDWRVVTDCSTYDLSCAALKLTQRAYIQYPFRFPTKDEGDYDWKNLTDVPELWMKRLHATAPKEPINETFVTADISPGNVSKEVYEACMLRMTNTPYEEQLDYVLKQIKRHPELDMIAFTMADFNYVYDMLHEVFQMNDDIVGFRDAFFMVALDQETLQLGCRFSYPVIASPLALATEEGLRSKVQSTKFLLSYDLLKRNVSFFFYEMDIFFLQSPVPVLLKMEGDAICSAHQDNPFGPNIGSYAFRANEASLEFFKLCYNLLEEAPETHDQNVFRSLLWLTKDTLHGNKADLHGPFKPKLPATPVLKHPIHLDFFESLAFAASEHPVPHEKTIAIHPLCGAPLKTPHGKKMMAKELRAQRGTTSWLLSAHGRTSAIPHVGWPSSGGFLDSDVDW